MTHRVDAIAGAVSGATATTAAATHEAIRQNLFQISWEIPYTLINVSVHEIVGLVGLSLSIFFAIRLYRNKDKD